jgi:hypothetical protein
MADILEHWVLMELRGETLLRSLEIIICAKIDHVISPPRRLARADLKISRRP